MPSQPVPVVYVRRLSDGVYCHINESDFNPQLHERSTAPVPTPKRISDVPAVKALPLIKVASGEELQQMLEDEKASRAPRTSVISLINQRRASLMVARAKEE